MGKERGEGRVGRREGRMGRGEGRVGERVGDLGLGEEGEGRE